MSLLYAFVKILVSYHNSQRIKLETLQKTGAYPGISFTARRNQTKPLCFQRSRHKEPLYLVSNSLRNTQLYLTYKRRMQIEECFRDIKTFYETARTATRGTVMVFSLFYAICFLHFEKSAERWIRTYNTRSTKTYPSSEWIIRILETNGDLTSSLTHILISDCAG